VEIAVTGIPENATIYFGEAKMPKNPFTVPSSKTMMQLKVSAPGYEDFLRWLEPSRDQTVTAELVPMTKTASASEAPKKKKRAKKKVARSETKEPEKKPEKTPKTPTAPKVEITKKPNQKLRQGGRGTKFTETFDD
jgi:hypothetical protein